MKILSIKTFQAYQPDPEIEKINSKYNTTQKNTQIEQPLTHWPSNIFNRTKKTNLKANIKIVKKSLNSKKIILHSIFNLTKLNIGTLIQNGRTNLQIQMILRILVLKI
ncbi:unnamed protein product [Paramecium octaurelia]|uniref:Uncharacterized protein n=1 Tax=Paramecium octaurelia TaxID=43137 RepID=A0A8S1TS10_PAROT|nr:unnamed protein product [Paramecium octaurelia]